LDGAGPPTEGYGKDARITKPVDGRELWIVPDLNPVVGDVPQPVGVLHDAAWAEASANLTAYAGKSIQLLIEATDAAGASLVEAAVGNIVITRG
jgi:hypothetical protein